MDGIHDLGGTDGTGPVDHRPAGPTFHAEWERRVFGMQFATGAYDVDEFRHAIERMEPAYYLSSSYYEHWLAALETLLTGKGILEADDLRDRLERLGTATEFDAGIPERFDPELADATRAGVDRGASRRREPVEPTFGVGEPVRVVNEHPAGHTRCPGYVRRARGTVERVDGTFPLPDANVRGEDRPEPVYHVRFEAAELWGEDAESDAPVYVDLWESYLEDPDT